MSLPPETPRQSEAGPQRTQGAAPDHIHVGPVKKTNWLAWILLGLGILAALLALSRCDRRNSAMTSTTPAATDATVVGATTTASVGTLGAYLTGTDVAPRTFAFDNLNFDTAKSAIRAVDLPTVDQVAAVLNEHPTARIRIAGYADARGSDAANQKLGSDRADALKAALVEKGVDAARIETVSGGADDPVATNSTVQGEAENRRTELVVLSR
jgi:outer membrane protein OmpA-like peptidoglycan-associated protein